MQEPLFLYTNYMVYTKYTFYAEKNILAKSCAL